MKVEQIRWTPEGGWAFGANGRSADLLLVFGDREALEGSSALTDLAERHPQAGIVGCSTAGEILDTTVTDGDIVATSVRFDSTRVRIASAPISAAASGAELGRHLGAQLPHEGLRYVLVLSEGVSVNGSELSKGLTAGLPPGVLVTGGLSGDAASFNRTVVVSGGRTCDATVVVVGFYGDALRVGHGCLGGWDPFGPDRVVTRSEGNVLYELDGRSALNLYKTYLGDHAARLPSSALLFPLSIDAPDKEGTLVRTVLAVDEEQQTMTFAGDIPNGARARFMKANFDRLVDGAHGAAAASLQTLGGVGAELAILISCVGRKLVLDQRIEEEVEGVREVLGPEAALTGFYSYGEISPLTSGTACELHNQTMTVTTLSES